MLSRVFALALSVITLMAGICILECHMDRVFAYGSFLRPFGGYLTTSLGCSGFMFYYQFRKKPLLFLQDQVIFRKEIEKMSWLIFFPLAGITFYGVLMTSIIGILDVTGMWNILGLSERFNHKAGWELFLGVGAIWLALFWYKYFQESQISGSQNSSGITTKL